jgi:hypothetical protein
MEMLTSTPALASGVYRIDSTETARNMIFFIT